MTGSDVGLAPAQAGFRSPESLIRNVYGYYGNGASDYSMGLPRDPDTARRFFDQSLRAAWSAPRDAPYDFLVQSSSWQLGPVRIAILRRQYDVPALWPRRAPFYLQLGNVFEYADWQFAKSLAPDAPPSWLPAWLRPVGRRQRAAPGPGG